MSTFDDPYRVLGINRSASEDEVKKAYRKAALQHHPDKCAPEDKEQAEIRFRAISEAYEILKDPTMRQRYDTFGMDGIKNGGARRSEGSPFGPSFGGFSGTAGQHPFFHDPRSIFE
ncbi:DnaJ-domain-containing protein [Rhizoclosmatium globosum]|uniref:DnaJ-domain-containing protein n=1 Tax=Rhizoclosmatium globosum TaxID=329046 RepID=A0A1Y2CUW2_9FUNG|nr:DnaJ-domain-containing protein [Rhizoclosmatium globosum]|eukprot:ORY50828.1 DnaJ-domain-containing protein [Rhizoclosmatium globosum]